MKRIEPKTVAEQLAVLDEAIRLSKISLGLSLVALFVLFATVVCLFVFGFVALIGAPVVFVFYKVSGKIHDKAGALARTAGYKG